MSIARLVRHFESLGTAPIALQDVVAEFRKLMPNENLHVTGVDLPANVIRGAHYSYTHHPDPASALLPATMVKVIYSKHQPPEWQRLVVCKELIHLFDGTGIKTDLPKEVSDLVNALSGGVPKSIKTGGNLQWFFDELAQYQAIAMLFPFSLREALNGREASKQLTQALAEKLMLPKEAIDFVMMDGWKELRESILLHG